MKYRVYDLESNDGISTTDDIKKSPFLRSEEYRKF